MTLSRRVRSGRADLAVEVAGAGDPVVFLHANVCDGRMWRHQAEAVSAGGRAVVYDRRGFGGTRAEAEGFSAVADLLAVMDAATDGGPAVLVGCSQGGKIAVDAALRHPSRVRALVLVAPTVTGAPEAVHPPEIQRLLARQRAAEAAGDPEEANAVKARLWLDGPLSPEGRVAGEARRLFLDMNGIALRAAPVGSSLDTEPVFHRLADIGVPCLVLWGDLDFPHIQERCRRIAAVLPDAAGHELAGSAHLPSLDRPEAVTRLLSDFLRRLS